MTRPLPTPTDRLTVSAPGEPPNNVEPLEGPLPAGAECPLWVGLALWRLRTECQVLRENGPPRSEAPSLSCLKKS